MKIVIAGSSGLVGTALTVFLTEKGHQVTKLARDHHSWDPDKGVLDPALLQDADAVINLSGENIATLWTEKKKQAILDSRVKSSQLISETIAKLQYPPKLLINASAVGYYGSRGDTLCTEDTSKGRGYLADVCEQWEDAVAAAKSKVRVVNLRFGIILSKKGGAFAKMLPPFKLGLGGTLGDGSQYMSWITIDDVVAIILFAIENHELEGPINVVSPEPVTNREFTKTLGKVLNRPTLLPVPAFALRLIFGEMADEMFLCSTRAEPLRLLQAKYVFQHRHLEDAFKYLL